MSILVVVLGTVVGITVMGTTNMVRSSRLAGTTNTMIADIHYARTLATKEARNFEIRFLTTGYQVARVNPSAVVLQRAYPTGVTASATDTATFFAWGLTAPITITVSSAGTNHVLQLAANGNVTR